MNNNICSKYLFITIITLLFVSIFSSPVTSTDLRGTIESNVIIETKLIKHENLVSEVWVDDDYYDDFRDYLDISFNLSFNASGTNNVRLKYEDPNSKASKVCMRVMMNNITQMQYSRPLKIYIMT